MVAWLTALETASARRLQPSERMPRARQVHPLAIRSMIARQGAPGADCWARMGRLGQRQKSSHSPRIVAPQPATRLGRRQRGVVRHLKDVVWLPFLR